MYLRRKHLLSTAPLSGRQTFALPVGACENLPLKRSPAFFLRSLDSSSLRCFTPFDCISHTRKHTEMHMCSLSLCLRLKLLAVGRGKGCMCCVVYSWKIKMLFCCSCVLQEDFMLKIACLFGSVCWHHVGVWIRFRSFCPEEEDEDVCDSMPDTLGTFCYLVEVF